MNTRPRFDAELQHLKDKLLEMVTMSKHAMDEAIDALKTQNLEKADEIIKNDLTINELEREINELVIGIITKQQPVASDLRRIMVAAKISSDIERIGDLAVNIAKSTKFIGTEPLIKPIEQLPQMAAITQQMLSDALDAFNKEDTVAAHRIAKTDDEVDNMFGEIVQELMGLMAEKPQSINQITQLTFICRYIERAGDHVTNIAENILYIVKGERVDLNF